MKKLICCLFSFVLFINVLEAQHESTYHFDGSRIINGHSVETLQEGEMESLIGHRFGRLNGGGYELFGLDQATIRIGLDYGIKNWLTVGFGRSSFQKTYDGFVKIRLAQQSKKMPLSITMLSNFALNTLRAPSPEEAIPFRSRLAYTNQIIASQKLVERLVIQIMPTYLHFNLVESPELTNDIFSVGFGGKYQLTKTIALTTECYFNAFGQLGENKTNSLSFGFDLNTGSHVFQLHFTNSAGMIEKSFIGETTGAWLDGDIHFGFNMVRTFKLKGRRY